jgi:hypothetical protein
VPGDHGAGFEGVEFVERVDPFESRLVVGLGEAGMDAVVDNITGLRSARSMAPGPEIASQDRGRQGRRDTVLRLCRA